MAKKRSRFKLLRPMVDVSSWMDLKGLGRSSRGILHTVKNIHDATPSQPLQAESFEEAMARLNIDENSLQKRLRECFYSSWFYFAAGLALFFYGFYVVFTGFLISGFVTFVLATLAFVLAYREAFWYYQMKIRKLGCSISGFFTFFTGRKSGE